MVTLWRRFRRDERGISLTEALIVTPIVILMFAAFVELGFLVFQWSQATKAVQIGARLLAVSDPLPTDMSALTADYGALGEQEAVPGTIVTVACGAGAAACDATRMARLISGSDASCDYVAGTTVGMCDVFPRITAGNVLVSYRRAGLGYVGRPSGPVVSITVELRNLNFEFLLLGRLLALATDTISIPAHPVTMTSEDMRSSL